MKARQKYPGIALIWLVVLLFVLIALLGVATDIGYVYYVAQQLQNAADAAALAGGQQVKVDVAAARQAAISVALANRAAGAAVQLRDNPDNAADGDVVIGRFYSDTHTFIPGLSSPNAVKAVARRTADSPNGRAPLFFGRILGLNSTDVSREAIAMSSGGTGAGLIALNPHAPDALRIFGTGVLDVNDGAIQVDSDNAEALSAGGTILIDAPVINVCGGTDFDGKASYNGELCTNQPYIPDPLINLPPPTWDPAGDLGAIRPDPGYPVTYGPGYYSKGAVVGNNCFVTLTPGIYILGGEGLKVSGTATFIAENVMFYITGGGSVTLVGTGQCRVTPPDDGTYEGVTFFQDRSNVKEASIRGTNLLDLEGTLYFSPNRVEITGTGDGFGNQLIADTITVRGEGIITINYDGRFFAPGFKSYLVK